MRFRLRTLVLLTALGPPLLAGFWFWGLPALLWWLMPKTFAAAVVIGIGNGVGFMFVGVLAQWWWAAYVARRPKHSR